MFSYCLPQMSSPDMWYYQHNIGHHQFTNIGRKDPDLSHNPQLYRIHSSIKHRPIHWYQNYTFILVWSLAVQIGMKIINPLKALIRHTYNNCLPVTINFSSLLTELLHISIYIYAVLVFPFMNFELGKALVFSIYPVMMFSLLFMINT